MNVRSKRLIAIARLAALISDYGDKVLESNVARSTDSRTIVVK